MEVTLSEIASNKTTVISVSGDVITIDSVPFDLSSIPEGGQVEGELPSLGLIKRVDGVIEITIEYHYDSALAEPMQSTNKSDYIIDCVAGEVPSPIQWLPLEQEAEAPVYDENDPMYVAPEVTPNV